MHNISCSWLIPLQPAKRYDIIWFDTGNSYAQIFSTHYIALMNAIVSLKYIRYEWLQTRDIVCSKFSTLHLTFRN